MKLWRIHESVTRRLLLGLVVFVMLYFKIIAFVNVSCWLLCYARIVTLPIFLLVAFRDLLSGVH